MCAFWHFQLFYGNFHPPILPIYVLIDASCHPSDDDWKSVWSAEIYKLHTSSIGFYRAICHFPLQFITLQCSAPSHNSLEIANFYLPAYLRSTYNNQLLTKLHKLWQCQKLILKCSTMFENILHLGTKLQKPSQLVHLDTLIWNENRQ